MADVYAMGHQRATFFGTGALHTHTHTRIRTAIKKQNQWSSLHLSTIFFSPHFSRIRYVCVWVCVGFDALVTSNLHILLWQKAETAAVHNSNSGTTCLDPYPKLILYYYYFLFHRWFFWFFDSFFHAEHLFGFVCVCMCLFASRACALCVYTH